MATHKPIEVTDLLGEIEAGRNGEKWWVIHTKPRCEKKLAEYSLKKGINYYLPITESKKIYKYRQVIFTKPLFPGYFFARCSSSEKRELQISGYTAYFLKVPNEEELLSELKQIYKGSNLGEELRLCDYLENGTEVEIIAGPFVGLTGVVKDFKNVNEVLMQISLLRKSVAVTASADQLKQIRGNR